MIVIYSLEREGALIGFYDWRCDFFADMLREPSLSESVWIVPGTPLSQAE